MFLKRTWIAMNWLGVVVSFTAPSPAADPTSTNVTGKPSADAATAYNRALIAPDAPTKIIWFTMAINADPKFIEAYEQRGMAQQQAGRFEEAIADFSQAIELDPKRGRAYYLRGGAWYDQKKFDRAIEDFDKAVPLMPKAALIYNWRGVAHLAKGDLDRARQDIATAIQLRPDYADAYAARGVLCSRSGDNKSALDDFNHAVRLAPDNPNLYKRRALFFRNRGMHERAWADLEMCRKLGGVVESEVMEVFDGTGIVKPRPSRPPAKTPAPSAKSPATASAGPAAHTPPRAPTRHSPKLKTPGRPRSRFAPTTSCSNWIRIRGSRF